MGIFFGEWWTADSLWLSVSFLVNGDERITDSVRLPVSFLVSGDDPTANSIRPSVPSLWDILDPSGVEVSSLFVTLNGDERLAESLRLPVSILGDTLNLTGMSPLFAVGLSDVSSICLVSHLDDGFAPAYHRK